MKIFPFTFKETLKLKLFDINTEKQIWDHPCRIQVTKRLRKAEIGSVITDFRDNGTAFAVEKRGDFFVLWREPEQEWDVDDASLEWFEEWRKHNPPPKKAFIFEYRNGKITKGDEKLITGENRKRRDPIIREEFKQLKEQGFSTKHIIKVLGKKYFLSPIRVRDIIYTSRKKNQGRQ